MGHFLSGSMALGMILTLGWWRGCGGGCGPEPQEGGAETEVELQALLLNGWKHYNLGDFRTAIDTFSAALEKVNVNEPALDPGVRRQVTAEAHNGIGWSYFRTRELDNARNAFRQATSFSSRISDAWVGWAGVALMQGRYADAVQFGNQGLEDDRSYNSALRNGPEWKYISLQEWQPLGHDRVDVRHVRLMLAEGYYQLGRYSAAESPDPNNAAAQVRLIRGAFRYTDPVELVQVIGELAMELKGESR